MSPRDHGWMLKDRKYKIKFFDESAAPRSLEITLDDADISDSEEEDTVEDDDIQADDSSADKESDYSDADDA